MIYAGTDLKYRITTSFEDFDLARDTFEIAIRNRWGQVKSTIKKDDCFYDSDGNYYFTVENVTNGVFFADFRGAYEDDDYDKQQRVVTDTQQLYEVGMCECRSIYVPCECEHKVRYEQVWTVSVDGGDYLADSEGRYIYTSDGKRIQFTNNTSEKVDDMGKVKMKMTGDEFLQLMEGRNPNGEVDTLPEMMKVMEGLSDDKTIKDDIKDEVSEHTEDTYVEDEETLYLDGEKPE